MTNGREIEDLQGAKMLIPWVTIRQISATRKYIVSVGRSNAGELLVFCHSNMYILWCQIRRMSVPILLVLGTDAIVDRT